MSCSRCDTGAEWRALSAPPGGRGEALCRRCREALLWSPYVQLVRELERRSPPASREERLVLAAGLGGVRQYLERSSVPVSTPPEIADFIHRYRRPPRRPTRIGLAALVCPR